MRTNEAQRPFPVFEPVCLISEIFSSASETSIDHRNELVIMDEHSPLNTPQQEGKSVEEQEEPANTLW